MAKPPIEKPLYPNVPNDAGVPALKRPPEGVNVVVGGLLATTGSGFLSSVAFDYLDDFINTRWVLYNQNSLKDAFGDVGTDRNALVYYQVQFSGQSNIANAPLEGGDFISYNKTLSPNTYQVGISCGSTEAVRKVFMRLLEDMRVDTQLYALQTPDSWYINLNVTSINYQRTSQGGVQLVNALLTLQEVRLYATTTWKNTKTGVVTSSEDQGYTTTAEMNSLQTARVQYFDALTNTFGEVPRG
ncbi:phage baseplate protein [Entomobacter blattae]|uniref:Uncharacterized protein n=1 Tax=Entomobacter blattae TaxID=2762277 RepID=A0A7H1NU42_9PROT|nr:hypothetical protein [Entomobacter blattae]QNT79302.1 hypothetical protein JGUZn3_20990 [Entomobacter blattae]